MPGVVAESSVAAESSGAAKSLGVAESPGTVESSGAAEALVGESGAAASNFARAECLLEFLLTEGPDGFGMDDTEVSVHEVPRDAWAGRHPDRDRVAKFATALAVRRAACADG